MAGYRTLVAAIPAFYGDCDQSVTKELYVDVGYQLKISKWKVEKDIRDVIRKAWKRRDREVWWAYFPQEKPPTNSEFMARVAEVVKLWQECAEKESV